MERGPAEARRLGDARAKREQELPAAREAEAISLGSKLSRGGGGMERDDGLAGSEVTCKVGSNRQGPHSIKSALDDGLARVRFERDALLAAETKIAYGLARKSVQNALEPALAHDRHIEPGGAGGLGGRRADGVDRKVPKVGKLMSPLVKRSRATDQQRVEILLGHLPRNRFGLEKRVTDDLQSHRARRLSRGGPAGLRTQQGERAVHAGG